MPFSSWAPQSAKAETATRHEVTQCLGDDHLSGLTEAHRPCAGVHHDAGGVPVGELHLPEVDAGADLHPDLTDTLDGRRGEPNGRSRLIEQSE